MALLLLIPAAPVLAIAMLAIMLHDGGTPIYRARRIGLAGQAFAMFKLRTMVMNADRLGGRLAPDSDPRITRIGAHLRRWKIDELPQLWNVVRGEMALVGPRPDTPCGVAGYTARERRVLSIRPGMTDLASLLFRDEGRLLDQVPEPLAFYLQTIRPVKSQLALLYVEGRSAVLDAALLWLTLRSLAGRAASQRAAARLAVRMGAEPELLAPWTGLGAPLQLASRSASPGTVRGWSGQMPRVS